MTNRETRDQAREAGQGEIYVMGSARVRNEEKEGRWWGRGNCKKMERKKWKTALVLK